MRLRQTASSYSSLLLDTRIERKEIPNYEINGCKNRRQLRKNAAPRETWKFVPVDRGEHALKFKNEPRLTAASPLFFLPTRIISPLSYRCTITILFGDRHRRQQAGDGITECAKCRMCLKKRARNKDRPPPFRRKVSPSKCVQIYRTPTAKALYLY